MSRLELPLSGPGGAARSLRVEREGAAAIVSPILGAPGLCRACWLRRRAATYDPAELVRVHPTDPVSAFERRMVATDRRMPPAQRSAIARTLRARREAMRREPSGSTTPRLTRIDPEGATQEEPVLAMPGCTACTSPPADTSSGLEALLGRSAGVITSLQHCPPLPGEPAYPFVVISTLCNPRLSMSWSHGAGASGKGATLEASIGSAVGEAIERYAATRATPELVVGRASQIRGAVDPQDLVGRPVEDVELAWVRAEPMHGQGTRWFPAASVLLYVPDGRPRSPLRPNSSGLAFGATQREACEAGLAEVVERHLFFACWFGARAVEATDVRSWLPEAVAAGFAQSGLELRVGVCGTLLGVTVAWASCWPRERSPERPGFALGLGTGHTVAEAAGAAALEMAQIYRGLTHSMRHPSLRGRAIELAEDPRKVVDPYDHALFHAARGPTGVPDPFGVGPPRPLRVGRLPEPGEAWAVDLTPDDVARVSSWRVARVLLPRAVPLHFGLDGLPTRMFDLGPRDEQAAWLHPLA